MAAASNACHGPQDRPGCTDGLTALGTDFHGLAIDGSMWGAKGLERIIGYHFRNRSLLHEALTHSALLNEPPGAGRTANERLAHLGDAVLGLAVRSALFKRVPEGTKGDLTEEAKRFLSNPALADLARRLSLQPFLEGGKGLNVDEGNALAGLLEAICGAVYLDSDYDTAAAVVEALVMR